MGREREGQAEIQELKTLVEKNRAVRKDTLSKLRYEFEEFVHKKLNKVIEDVEAMKMTERQDDSDQQAQIDRIINDCDRLKQNLCFIQGAWGKLVSSCLNSD